MLTQRFLAVLCAIFVEGCAASAPVQVEHAAPLPPTNPDGTYEVRFPDTGHHVWRAHSLAVGPAEPAQCRFSPHFPLGSAEPLPQDLMALEAAAACLQSELARNRPIEIVGHADIRGSAVNNWQLGQARAERIRDMLVAQGVDASRIHVRSVGEYAARGFLSSYSHGFDRRVDVKLMYSVRQPSDTNRGDLASNR